MQRIRRLLLLAERYVSTIEATHPSNRSILPHAAMFRGRPLRIKIIYDTKKEEFTIEVHQTLNLTYTVIPKLVMYIC